MKYYKIIKAEEVNGSVTYTPIGYLDSEADKNSFEQIHGFPLTEWYSVNTDKDLVDYFLSNSACYLIDTVNDLPESLSLVTNIENPEE